MLHLHLSNRTEVLFDKLCELIAQPIKEIFQPEVIVVERKGMARWLSQQLAVRQGIAANIDFPLPAGFMWNVLRAQLQADLHESSFSKDTFLWYSLALLPELKTSSGFEAIQRYLATGEIETKTYQLSYQIADLFDQYLVYRPEMILCWEAGKEQHWQAQLWRAMRKLANGTHWAGLLENFKSSLEADGLNPDGLPERISIFAVSTLSPAYIELLALLAQYIDVHLYIINPSINYWGDIVSEQDLARLRDVWRKNGRPDVSDLYTVGNPLLASMGKPGRDFLDLWQDHAPVENEAFVAPEHNTLLSFVQGDILHLQARGADDLPALNIELDDSIQVHACHSQMREVQILHDRLLSLFDRKPDLKPHEIIVMAPDISLYAAYIESVFGSAPEERFIPYSIAKLPLSQQPLIETLMAWLQLADERFAAATVMAWLEIPAVQAKLSLGSEGIERIRQWIAESGICWGLDAQHKEELGLPTNELNTWEFGFKRLFLGYAMSAEAELFHGLAPFSAVEGSEAVWLGQLCEFITRLTEWRKVLATPATLLEWQARINHLIEQFFQPEQDEATYLDNLRTQMASLVHSAEAAGFNESVNASIMHQLLADLLVSAGDTHQLFSGRVTFCDMISARSIPFRVVCLLGVNDDDFPRRQRPLGFDLIAQDPHKGDRCLRDDDRYLFLESLLSAREILHISYIGRSQQDNSERLASVVVSELFDYIEDGYRLPEGDLPAEILLQHPLQSFSQRNFVAGSYAAEWLERDSVADTFSAARLPAASVDERQSLTLDALQLFLSNPSRYFLEQVLGVHSAEYEDTLAETERFELDALNAYLLKDEMLTDLIHEKEDKDHLELFLARGELPHGIMAHYYFDKTLSGMNEFSEKVRAQLDGKHEIIDIDLMIGGFQLDGQLTNVVDGRHVCYRAVRLGNRDRLSLWLAHLARCAAGNVGESLHLGIDNSCTFAPLPEDEALEYLTRFVSLYQQGRRSPLPLFMNSSQVYAERFLKSGDAGAAMMAAKAKWEGSAFSRGDLDDPWIAQAFSDRNPLDEHFAEIALTVWQPILEQGQV